MTAPVLAAPTDEEEFTIQRSTMAERGAGETVLAGRCPSGHLSPAFAPTCRICDLPMPPQEPVTVPRPVLGVLVLESGDTVDLSRGAILGRAPRIPEDATERPHLVNLAAYGRDVSRQHAEVLISGWNVFVRDLGSANGTRLRQPTGTVIDLGGGDPRPLENGAIIDIADVTTVTYRVTG